MRRAVAHDALSRKIGRVASAGIGLALICTAMPASAQTPRPLGALRLVPQGSPLPRIEPKTEPNLGKNLPNFRPLGIEGAVPNASVPVRSVAVIGATAFPEARLKAAVGSLSGGHVPLKRIEAARLRLLNLYRDHGYVLTAVSAEINGKGDLRFIVTEGRIVSVKLSRDIGPAGTLVLGFLDHLTHERPVREVSLEHWLLLAERIPGLSVTAVLQPNDAGPGALTLVADVAHKSVTGLVTADNRGFDETGPAQGLAVLDANSLTRFGEQTQLSLFHTSGGTNNFGQAQESFFVGTSGLRIGLYGGYGRAYPGGVLREINYGSRLTVFGVNATYPLLLRRGQSLDLTLRFDGTDTAISTSSSVLGSSSVNKDSIRAIRLNLQEAFTDQVFGASRPALTTASLEFSKGLTILGGSANGRPNAGRLGAQFDFWKLNAAIDRTQTLFSPWSGASVALDVGAGGQFSPDILPSPEEFYLGGTHITQGYYSGEVVGDKALYASAELQLNQPIGFRLFGRAINIASQFYAFYDWGEAWENRVPGQLQPGRNKRLASAGGGVRLHLTERLDFDLAVAHRFVTQLQPVGSGIPPLAGTAVYWGVLARY